MKKNYLKQLFNAMYHGKYSFHDFISCEVSNCYETFEANGRLIFNPNKKLNAYHSFLNLFLFEYLKICTDVVFSYRKGFNAYDAVSKHASNKYFYQTDLINFFRQLDFDLVRRTILRGHSASPILDVNDHIDRILELVTVNKKIPIGFSTSPAISNACLFEFDKDLELVCKQHDMTYTRYSDDIIISSLKKDEILEVELKIQSMLNNHFGGNMLINRSKSKVSSTGDKIKLLGMVILPNGTVSLDQNLKNKIEVHLHYYCTDREKFLRLVNGNSKAGLGKVSGWINYASTVDIGYLDKLRKKYGTTVIDMFIHKSAK